MKSLGPDVSPTNFSNHSKMSKRLKSEAEHSKDGHPGPACACCGCSMVV